MSSKVYFDNQATTQLDQRVLEAMSPFFSVPCNMHSRSHSFGWNAEDAVEKARKSIADLLGAATKEIIFTSGATESNNLAIKGLAEFYSEKKHIITVKTEHKCVLDTCRYLESKGFDVTYLPVQKNGIIDLKDLENAITENTLLVSIMMVNNEIGVIQPIEEIGEICKKHEVFFHTDAAQAFGKIAIDVKKMNINLLSISGHKIYGPMGVGALYVQSKNPRVRLKCMMHGGSQERGMRSGTIAVPLAVGLGKATQICEGDMESEFHRIKKLSDLLYNKIKSEIPEVVLNGDPEKRWPGNLNISFPYIEGESIIMAIKELAVSSGSACTSDSLESSYVLKALGTDEILAHSSIRIGIGRFNTEEQVLFASELIVKKIKKLLDMSPLWEMAREGVDLNNVKWNVH